jgi:hypothetical protein
MDAKQSDKKVPSRPTGEDAPKRPEDTTSSGDAKDGRGEDNHVQKKEK